MDSLPSDIRQQLIKLKDDKLRRKLEDAGYTVENTPKMSRGELQDAYAPIFLAEQQPQPLQAVYTNPNIETSEVFETDTEDLTREKLELHMQQMELEKFRLQMEHESHKAIEHAPICELEMEAQRAERESEAQREERQQNMEETRELKRLELDHEHEMAALRLQHNVSARDDLRDTPYVPPHLTLAGRAKMFGDAIRNCSVKMTSDPMDAITFFPNDRTFIRHI